MKRDDMSLLERYALVLDAFPAGEALSLSDACARTGLPRSTVHRMLVSLAEVGWVQRVGPRFELGMMLFELGERVAVKHRLRTAAMPFVQDLFAVTGHTVHLAVRDGLDVVYVEKLQGHSSLPLPSQVGGRMPLTCTGVGKALLAFGSDDLRRDVLTRPLRRYTAHTIVDTRVLNRQLDDIARTGVAVEREEAAVGGCCVASPILVGGVATAALSVSVPTTDFRPELLAPAIRTATLALALGRVLTRAADRA